MDPVFLSSLLRYRPSLLPLLGFLLLNAALAPTPERICSTDLLMRPLQSISLDRCWQSSLYSMIPREGNNQLSQGNQIGLVAILDWNWYSVSRSTLMFWSCLVGKNPVKWSFWWSPAIETPVCNLLICPSATVLNQVSNIVQPFSCHPNGPVLSEHG